MPNERFRRCIRCGSEIDDAQEFLYCANCRESELTRERLRVQMHNTRAAQAGLPADLTLEQWLETIMDFNGMCAYCQERPFEHLEHFIPIDAGGGTTLGNCVPACGRCNWSKGSSDPDLPQLEFFVNNPRERVRDYLIRRADSAEEERWTEDW